MHRCLRKRSVFARQSRWFWHRPLTFAVLVGFTFTAGSTHAEEQSLAASTSAEARADAIKAIPLKLIDPDFRPQVAAVLDDTSVFRRLPTQVVDCDPAMFTYMARHPEVLVEIWRELKITQVTLDRIDKNSFRMADGAGTTGTLTIVEQTCQDKAQNRFVMYAEGAYEGKPFAKPVRAECVILLRSGSLVENDGRTYVAARLDSFIHIDRASLEIFAKVVHPLVGKTADRNFGDTITFIGGFSQAAEVQPLRIKHLAESLPNVSPASQRELVKVAYDCHENSATVHVADGDQTTRR
jgi:hypothetical protein